MGKVGLAIVSGQMVRRRGWSNIGRSCKASTARCEWSVRVHLPVRARELEVGRQDGRREFPQGMVRSDSLRVKKVPL